MYTVIGGILVTLGSFGASAAFVTIMTNTAYTWTEPFTDFESGIITLFIISVLAIIGGVGTFIFGYIKAKNQKSLNELINSSSNSEVIKNKCSNCGINLSETCTKCPACGAERIID